MADTQTGEKPILAPSRSYKMTLKIKGQEYSNDLTSVKLSSSLATGYQIVVLTILMTPQTIILNKLYGQDSINLSIVLLDHSEFERERLDLDLMVINSEFEIPVSEVLDTGSQRDRTSFQIITVTRIPFQIMSTNAGCVFGYGEDSTWSGNKTVKDMISTMVKEFTPQAKLEYDSDDENPEPITQCCIPPNSLYRSIKLMDANHGIYNGVPSSFCQFDNTLQIMNLSTRIKKNYDILIEHLTTDSATKDVDKPTTERNVFYTYDNLFTNYVGNSKFGILGSTLKHIVLPSDRLSHTITQDLGEICSNYGLIGTGNKENIYVDKPATGRTVYYIENNGVELTETQAISKISKKISNLARLSFSIEKNLAVDVLIKIGSVVKLKTKTINHQDISGKYILFSSDITWVKSGEWQTVANLELIRTNKTI